MTTHDNAAPVQQEPVAAEAIGLAKAAIEVMTEFHRHAQPDETPDMNALFPAAAFKCFVDEQARLMYRVAQFEKHPTEPAYLRLRKAAGEVCSVLGAHGEICARDDRVQALLDAIYGTDDGAPENAKPVYAAPVAAQPQEAVATVRSWNPSHTYGTELSHPLPVGTKLYAAPAQDKPQEAGPSVSVDERGWLLEQVSCPHPMWMKADGHMTKDASRAIRFARECDANAFLNLVFSSKEIDFAKLLGRSNYQATEHIWHDFDPSIAALNTAPAVQEAAEVSIDDDKFWSLLSDWADVRGYQGEKRSPCVERAEDAILFYVHRWAVSLLLAAAAPSAPSVPTYEHQRATMEAERNAATDEYFKARWEGLNTIHNRRIFEAGFQRGYEVKPSAPPVIADKPDNH